VTVNSVAPGHIGTDITGGALEGERKTQLLAGSHIHQWLRTASALPCTFVPSGQGRADYEAS